VPECYIVFTKVSLTNIQSELTVSSLHTVMAAFGQLGMPSKTVGLTIEAWSEADIYGPTTLNHNKTHPGIQSRPSMISM